MGESVFSLKKFSPVPPHIGAGHLYRRIPAWSIFVRGAKFSAKDLMGDAFSLRAGVRDLVNDFNRHKQVNN